MSAISDVVRGLSPVARPHLVRQVHLGRPSSDAVESVRQMNALIIVLLSESSGVRIFPIVSQGYQYSVLKSS